MNVDLIPAKIQDAVRRDDDAAFDALCSHEEGCFAVDSREMDDDIVKYCESILQTGRLSAEWVGIDLFMTFGTKRVQVPLTESVADRHITLLALNDVLSPEFEVRMLYASHGNDTLDFVPLSSEGWLALEREAPEVVLRRFLKLTSHLNIFADPFEVPRKVETRPWWHFWGRE